MTRTLTRAERIERAALALVRTIEDSAGASTGDVLAALTEDMVGETSPVGTDELAALVAELAEDDPTGACRDILGEIFQ
jgi:hypothetical protein